jgi:hypothetical protein
MTPDPQQSPSAGEVPGGTGMRPSFSPVCLPACDDQLPSACQTVMRLSVIRLTRFLSACGHRPPWGDALPSRPGRIRECEPVSGQGHLGGRAWRDGVPGGSCRGLARPSTPARRVPHRRRAAGTGPARNRRPRHRPSRHPGRAQRYRRPRRAPGGRGTGLRRSPSSGLR